MTTAITVENLGKRYRIGHTVKRAATAGEAIKNALSSPFRYLKYRLSPMTEEDTLWAIRNISFEVKEGEVLGIIGANGAGKSTLLKILSRITDPTEGRAVIRGRVNALLEVGVGFNPELTGRENIYLSASLHGLTAREIRAKLDEIVDFAGVDRFLDTPVKRYSSGMKVRLGFAVAANLEPEVLIVDEVLAVGDVAFQQKCLGKMEEVTSQGRTVLFVSHQMEAIANLCHNCLLLRGGTVALNAEPQTVIEAYIKESVHTLARCLTEREDRNGVGNFLFTDTWLENEKGERIQGAFVGQSVKIAISYEITEPNSVRDLHVAIGLYSIKNVSICELANIHTGQLFAGIPPKSGIIRCRVDRLPLNVGSYTYNLIAKSRGMVVEDHVVKANSFTVHAGDFYGTGFVPDAKRLVLMEQSWEIKPGT